MRVWTGRPRLKLGSVAAPALLIVVTALTILPWTVRNADRHAPLHPDLRRDRNHARRHLQRGVRRHARSSVQVADLLRHPGRARPDPRVAHAHRTADRFSPREPGAPLHLRLTRSRPSSSPTTTCCGCSRSGALRLAGLGFGDLDLGRASPGGASSASGSCARWRWPARSPSWPGSAPKWIWWVPILLALSVVVVNVETPRFREPVDPFLILLATAALATAVGRLRGAPVVGERRGPIPARPAQLVEMVERLA